MIRKITLLALFVTVFTFGCKKDEKNEKAIVGKWSITSVTEIEYENGAEVGRDDDTEDGMTFEFKSDGNGTTNLYGQTINFSYTTTESTLTLKAEGETEVLQIKKLNKSEMELTQETTETIGGVVYKEVFEVKLRKN